MVWLHLTLFAILNIYCLIYFHQINKKLYKEITVTKQWCKDMVESLIVQENKIDELLIEVIKDINNSKITSDVIEIANNNKYEDHLDVCRDLQDEQTRLTHNIINVKKKQTEMMSDLRDKFEEFPGE